VAECDRIVPYFDNLLKIHEHAVEDRNWSAAVSAETARGRVTVLHENETILEIEEAPVKISVIELAAGVKD